MPLCRQSRDVRRGQRVSWRAPPFGRLRQRGPQPKLADSEVITIELVGAFWKLGTDRDLFRHFRRYHTAEFPALAQVDRTTFARQAANLWRVKQLIQQRRMTSVNASSVSY